MRSQLIEGQIGLRIGGGGVHNHHAQLAPVGLFQAIHDGLNSLAGRSGGDGVINQCQPEFIQMFRWNGFCISIALALNIQ